MDTQGQKHASHVSTYYAADAFQIRMEYKRIGKTVFWEQETCRP